METKPLKPTTGYPLETGFDVKMWSWVYSIERLLNIEKLRLDTRIDKIAGAGGAAAAAYTGPFAVSKKNDTTISILAGNIIHGIDKISVAAADLAVSVTGVVYIELTYPSGTATTEFKNAAEMPALESGKYQKKLATVVIDDSKIKSVTQVWKNDDIEVAGRL